MFELGDRVRAARVGARLSREALGTIISVSPGTIGRIETGARLPTRREIEDIADACGVPDWFLKHGWQGWHESADFKIRLARALD